jgi:hypothetical protein
MGKDEMETFILCVYVGSQGLGLTPGCASLSIPASFTRSAMLCKAVVPRIRTVILHPILRTTCLRLKSTSELLTSFPLQLPKHFKLNPSSVTYCLAHQPQQHGNEANARTIPVENPATAQVIHSIECASERTIDNAINCAHEVFQAGTWSRLPLTTRYQTLLNIANLLRESCHSLAARIFLSFSHVIITYNSRDFANRSSDPRDDCAIGTNT